jgi:anti-sigma factor ChrR (cupin superfamily)
MSHTTTDEELTGQAALYALGALDEEEAREFECHVAGCEACAAEMREFRVVAADLALAVPPATPPPDVRSRLLSLVAEGENLNGREAAASQTSGEDVNGERRDDAEARRATEAEASSREASPKESPGFIVIRSNEGEWRPTADPGVSFKLLFVDRERATVTTLVRMGPGARIPAHRHLGLEQCLVLEGDLRSGGIEMSAGDFNCSMPGSVHDELTTEGGALFIIISPERYERVGPRHDSAS